MAKADLTYFGRLRLAAGAKLDVWLASRQGLTGVQFSRALVLKRYHRKVSRWDTILYRWLLLRVRDPDPHSLKDVHAAALHEVNVNLHHNVCRIAGKGK